jgi:hypothetical protein
MESPVAIIPATTAGVLIAAFGLGTLNTSPAALCRPQRRASASSGTSPADDTKFDRRTPPTHSKPCERVPPQRCPSSRSGWNYRKSQSPSPQGHPRGTPR